MTTHENPPPGLLSGVGSDDAPHVPDSTPARPAIKWSASQLRAEQRRQKAIVDDLALRTTLSPTQQRALTVAPRNVRRLALALRNKVQP